MAKTKKQPIIEDAVLEDANAQMETAQPEQPELVYLSNDEVTAYNEASQKLMQNAAQVQEMSVTIREKRKELDTLEANRDSLTDDTSKLNTSIVDILTKYAFKYEKNVIGVHPQTGAVVFEGEEHLHQMQGPVGMQ